MEESTKKIFKPKFELVHECLLFQYIWVSTLLRLYFKGQKSLEPRKIIKCWCVVQFLETLPNALGVRPEELCQDKARIFI
jgi:hypothetical protein